MKKLLCFAAVLALVLGLAMTVSAAGNETVTLTAGGTTYPGNLVTVTVEINGCDPVVGLMLYPEYDWAVFDRSGETYLVNGDWIVTAEGECIVNWNRPTDINGALIRFSFEVRGDAAPGKVTELGCQLVIITLDGTSVEIENVSTVSVTVAACQHTTYLQVEDEKYIKTPGNCRTPNEYYVCCQTCGAAGEETFFSSKAGDHRFDEMKETEEYLCEVGDCVTGSTYYYSCSGCGLKGTEIFEGAAGGNHVFDAMVEKEEYLSDPGDCQTKRQYYYSCSGCGLKGEETFVSLRKFGVHEFDNSCDTECNVCGKYQEAVHVTGEEWDCDENGHFHLCTQCQEKIDLQEHIPGPEATAEEHQVCTVCGFVLAVSDAHEHEYSPQWSHDDKSHWHECSCQAKSDLSVHSWTVVESDRTDVLIAKCDTCGVTKEEPVATGPDDPQPSETIPTRPAQTVPAEQEDNGGNVPALILGILLILSLAGNVALTVLLITGKKKK